ncbi:right-handed parallel beta-helix repeat-containing protein [Patescibacteria group bacterium]|nr:right-handed parallel beta-helix repeat-containing protein [Patescibacteria group bacterium]MBU4601445.1 right-handed parallel beta-helix repeat-containing protein [Patescibacteria group bacterium]MCG2697764.1 right-handed parallel beta-helix repeat-containing protein [Candidatus Parcubacteria bacterium]
MFSRRNINIVLALTLILSAGIVFGYDNSVIHPSLTEAAAEIYNNQANKKITNQQIDWMVGGSIAEDAIPRYLNHFYNPTTGKGLDSGALKGAPAKEWAKKQDSVSGDYSVGAIFNNYREGDLKRAYQGIGHILHLIQDMSVPAHTRNDPHPNGDPFEAWAEQYGKVNLNKTSFIKADGLDQVFNELANYSHNNFFSKDTIDNNFKFNNLKIEKDLDGVDSKYAYNGDYKIIKIKEYLWGNEYVFDFKVHLDYWNMLSPKATGYSAGVVDYFIKEFEKIDKEESAKQKLSFWGKIGNKLNIFSNEIKYVWGDTLIASKQVVDKSFDFTNEKAETAGQNIEFFAEANKEIISETARQSAEVIKDAGVKVLAAVKELDSNIPPVITAVDLLKPKQAGADDENFIEKGGDIAIGVDRVIDGDTIVLTTGEKVRYIGIDTPELGKPGAEDDECLAWAARIRNMELLSMGELKLIKDQAADKDKYGRLLRYVYINEVFINEQLAREGLAETFFCLPGWENCPVTADKQREKIIINARNDAEKNSRGLFSSVCAQDEPEDETLKHENTKTKEQENTGAIKQHAFVQGGNSSGSGSPSDDLLQSDEQEEQEEQDEQDEQEEQEEQDEQDEQGEIIPVVSYFNLFDFISGSTAYAASTSIGIDLEIENQDAVSDYFLSAASTTPDINDKDWASSSPQSFILSDGDGVKSVYLWLKYGEDKIADMASSSIVLDTSAPIAAIGGLEEQYDNSGFAVNWSGQDEASSTIASGLADFDVQYRINNNEWQDWISAATSTGAIFNIAVDAGSGIYFIVRARDNAGNVGEWSSEAETKIADAPAEPPAAPVIPNSINDLIVQNIYTSNNSVRLFWTSPENAGLNEDAYYDLRYKEKTGDCDLDLNWAGAVKAASSTIPAPDSLSGQRQTAEITGLTAGTEYCFAAIAYNGEAWSGVSNQASAKTKSIFAVNDLTRPAHSSGYLLTQTLTADKSPYYFDRDARMRTGKVLTIEPGVVIKIGGWYISQSYKYPVIFLIDGKIIAQGTENNPIVFTSIYDDSYGGDSNCDGDATSPGHGSWGGLQISSGDNIFDHVIMKYGGGDRRGLITFYSNNGNQITNSVFENNWHGIDFRAASSSDPSIIEHNMFFNNKSAVIYFHDSANPVIRYNNIYNNNSGIGVSDVAAPIINYNNIYNNGGYGAAVNQWYYSTQLVDVKFNWWGDESGPEHAGNPGGIGSKVTDKIDFSDWLLSMYE